MLYWNNLNNVAVKYTTKKFYNKYLNKIVVYCPGARVIYDKRSLTNIDEVIKNRMDSIKYLSRYNNWTTKHKTEDWDKNQLYELTLIKSIANHLQIKIRIEEPFVSIYSNDVDQLQILARKLGLSKLKEIFEPENSNAVEILNRGEIITKRDTEFQYKIVFREQYHLQPDVRNSILDYLYNLGDEEVSLTKGLIKNLGQGRIWFPGGYFYCKDEKIATFISLIAPGMISGIFKLGKLEQ